MLSIYIAPGKIESFPSVEGEMYILATSETTVPLSLFNQIGEKKMIIENIAAADSVTVALNIGFLAAKTKEKDITVYTDDSELTKQLNTKMIDIEEHLALRVLPTMNQKRESGKKTGTEKKRRTSFTTEVKKMEKQETMEDFVIPETKKEELKVPAAKGKLLKNAGIADELIERVYISIQQASDFEITFPLQLNLNLALVNVPYDKEEIIEKVKPIFTKLKK